MSVRPYQRTDEVVRKGDPTNIHLWVVKECDNCGFTQRFAAGAATMYNVNTKMQRQYCCRKCRQKRHLSQQRLVETAGQGDTQL